MSLQQSDSTKMKKTDNLRHFKPTALKIFEKYLPRAFIGTVVVIGYFIAMFVIQPWVFEVGSFFFFIHLLLCHIELFLLVYTYFKCADTDPGCVKQDWQNVLPPQELQDLMTLERKQNGNIRFCEKCSLEKPPRAHHCSHLNRFCISYRQSSFYFCLCIYNL